MRMAFYSTDSCAACLRLKRKESPYACLRMFTFERCQCTRIIYSYAQTIPADSICCELTCRLQMLEVFTKFQLFRIAWCATRFLQNILEMLLTNSLACAIDWQRTLAPWISTFYNSLFLSCSFFLLFRTPPAKVLIC